MKFRLGHKEPAFRLEQAGYLPQETLPVRRLVDHPEGQDEVGLLDYAQVPGYRTVPSSVARQAVTTRPPHDAVKHLLLHVGG